MKRIMLATLSLTGLALSGFGCATFDDLTPKGAYVEASHGIWVAKSSGFMGMRTASQEVLFCSADNKMKPMCMRAGGDTDPAKTGGKVQ